MVIHELRTMRRKLVAAKRAPLVTYRSVRSLSRVSAPLQTPIVHEHAVPVLVWDHLRGRRLVQCVAVIMNCLHGR